ncbi:MAG: precorrin-6y C5,15-methyltransferase (decarboxylating) subunit CbiE [Nocardioidaceae bacterium]|nr:precorrin-6y C5,15-methyltransferase (decarboxylating) subunit CbiE [Nocardioidaceae bacterium]
MTAAPPSLHVIGIGADGWPGLAEATRDRIRAAAVILGGARHLDLLPDDVTGRRVPWPSPLRAGLPDLLAGIPLGPVVALASGDPLVSGIGTTLLDLLPEGAVTIEPAVSSVALARAEMGWPAESCAVVSVVGRDVALVARELAPGRRILALSSDEHTPRAVAELLTAQGYGESMLTVLGDLGSPAARRTEVRASDCRGTFSRLNIVAIESVGTSVGASWTAGLPDSAFEHDGQLTKRDLRASALARLAPAPGEHLWDVGAGAGSVGIEWMRAHPTCTATAVESDPDRAARIGRNARTLGVPGLGVVEGRAPDALDGLRRPHAIFVGGGATRDGVIEACLAALRPGGRLVVHGVTLETEQLLASLHREHGGELTRISIEQVDAIGTFRGWAPLRTVTQWALTR